MERKIVLEARDLTRKVSSPEGELTIVDHVSLQIRAGESVALIGASGAGKSTLLAMLAGLDVPTSGSALLEGKDLGGFDEDARARLRANSVGFVFQAFHLLPALTALENVMLPLELAGRRDAAQGARVMLSRVGLAERVGHYPRQLSGGEQQRVALARASVTRPAVLFADEPTGNLDTTTGTSICDLLFELNREAGTTLVLVTHDATLAARCERRLTMAAGRLVDMRIALTLGLRTLVREGRSGDLAVLFLALFVAVAALTGVGFLVDRVNRAMQLQASEVLGADLRLQSSAQFDSAYAAEAARRHLQVSRVTSLLSVILKGERTQLANVGAVAGNYPLRGQVKVASQAFGASTPIGEVPAAGEVWPDSRLLAALDARLGDTISVGSAELRVARVLVSRPDQGSGFVDLAPSLLMNEADLPATRLIQPGSRVGYSALYAGERGAIEQFGQWLRQNRKANERLRDIAEASPEVGNAAARAGQFLSLASLVGVLLCAVAIAMTARRYVKRHLDFAALLKTLGATRGTVLGISLVQLVCIALAAAVTGALAGFLAQQGLLSVVKGMIAAELPPPGWRPVLMGLAAALLLLVGCALPPILQLARVPAIRVLRRDIGPPPLAILLAYGPAVLVIAVLIRVVTGGGWLSVGFMAGLVVAIGALALAGWLLVTLVGRLRAGTSIIWRYGAANLARRRAESILQIVALGLGLSALLLLTIVRGDLIEDWQGRLPKDPPNYFFVNIPGEERDEFQQLLIAQGAKTSRLLPMIRGRLVAINGEAVNGRRFGDGRGEGFAMREQNLSWSDEIGVGNKVTAGHWFTPEEHGQPLVSVATDFMESMSLKLGDKLTFNVAGETVEVAISSFREVQWDSLQPNFFLMFAPGLLDGVAGTWMASAQYRPEDPSGIAAVVRRFPGISIFDVDQLYNQVRSIMDKAVIAVQSVFLFTLLAGVVVLLAAVQATRDERRYESAMLRTLGATRRTVLAGVLLEFALLGLAAGVIAAAAAAVGGQVLATQLLEIPYRADPLLWITGGLTGALLVCVAGWLATRTALNPPPMQILRQG